MEQLDERWGDPAYWQVIRRNASSYTPYYLLAALDHRIDDLGEVARATRTRPSTWTSSPAPSGWAR